MQGLGATYWETRRILDFAAQIDRISLPGRAGTKELQTLVSRLASEPLDPARPLWQFHLVDNFGEGSALILRIHHCYADGIALVRVFMSMTDAGPKGPPAMPFEPAPRRRGADTDDPLRQLLQPLSGVLKLAQVAGAALVEKGAAIWSDPALAVALAGQGGALTAEIAKLALMPQDSPTRFKGTPGVAKRVAWAEPIPLDEVKAVSRALGASVNDVLLSCVAGALRDYLAAKGDATDGVMIRAMVPVNLRPLEKAYRLGNQFGLVFLELPLGIENPIERLYAVRANMKALKDSYQPILALGLLAAMGAGPKLIQERVAAGAGAQRHRGDDQCARTAAGALFRRRGDRALPVLGTPVRRHRDGRVDPVVRRQRAIRAHHRPRLVSRPRARHRRLRRRVREARADDAALAVAARRRSRSGDRRGREVSARRPLYRRARSAAYSSSERASSTSRRSIASAGLHARRPPCRASPHPPSGSCRTA